MSKNFNNDLENKFNQLCQLYNNHSECLYSNPEPTEESITNENIAKISQFIKNKINEKKKYSENIINIRNYIKLLNNYLDNIEISKKLFFDLKTNCLSIQSFEKNLDIYSLLESNEFTNMESIYLKQQNKIDSIKFNLETICENLSSNINSCNKSLNEYKSLILNCIEDDINKYINPNLCTICYENNINICLNPCGHTICTNCSNRLNDKCFICNQIYNNKIKIYISQNNTTTQNIANNMDDINAYNDDESQYYMINSNSFENSQTRLFFNTPNDVFRPMNT